MTVGAFDGARSVRDFTSAGCRTKIDLDGDFPVLPGMTVEDELKVVDGIFSMPYEEGTATIPSGSEFAAGH